MSNSYCVFCFKEQMTHISLLQFFTFLFCNRPRFLYKHRCKWVFFNPTNWFKCTVGVRCWDRVKFCRTSVHVHVYVWKLWCNYVKEHSRQSHFFLYWQRRNSGSIQAESGADQRGAADERRAEGRVHQLLCWLLKYIQRNKIWESNEAIHSHVMKLNSWGKIQLACLQWWDFIVQMLVLTDTQTNTRLCENHSRHFWIAHSLIDWRNEPTGSSYIEHHIRLLEITVTGKMFVTYTVDIFTGVKEANLQSFKASPDVLWH